jgi:hypothetical protein
MMLRWMVRGGAGLAAAVTLGMTIWILTAPTPGEVCAHEIALRAGPTDSTLLYMNLICIDRSVRRRSESFLRLSYAAWARCSVGAKDADGLLSCND